MKVKGLVLTKKPTNNLKKCLPKSGIIFYYLGRLFNPKGVIMICKSLRALKKYCREPIENIKNYAEAVADTTQVWDLHHWNEQWWTMEQLEKMGMYKNRPASELVFVPRKEHFTLKHAGRDEGWRKLRGKPLAEETKRKLSLAHKGLVPWNVGKHFDEATKAKISMKAKGRPSHNKGRHKVIIDGKIKLVF